MAKYTPLNVSTAEQGRWGRSGNVVTSDLTGQKGIEASGFAEAAKYAYGTAEERAALERPKVSKYTAGQTEGGDWGSSDFRSGTLSITEPHKITLGDIFGIESIITTGFESGLTKQMMPYNVLPQTDPRYMAAFTTFNAQKMSKLAMYAEDQNKLLTQKDAIATDQNLTPKQARGLGIKYRSTLKKIKDRIITGEDINFNTKEMRKIVLKLNLYSDI